MPRANRFHIPGYIWHITHRCHKKEFLLKFNRDRRRWLYWLFKAKKRFGLNILNYTVTSNHIHLLVVDGNNEWAIPRSMQLVEGRMGQEYNQRKNRRGAFWEDRYHATAVQPGRHLARCMAYIDLNMVRAGVVGHPAEWEFGGYQLIQNPPQRYMLVNRPLAAKLLNCNNPEELAQAQRDWINQALASGKNLYQPEWTESIAVGDYDFVKKTMEELGIAAQYREIAEEDGIATLREPEISYRPIFDPKIEGLSSYRG
jgi:putative transposase